MTLPPNSQAHRSIALSLMLSASALSGGASAATAVERIDPVVADPDAFQVLMENEEFRLVEHSLAPGQKDAWHTLPPNISYVLSGGKVRVRFADGKSFRATEHKGASHQSGAVGMHFVENIGNSPIRILLLEPKTATGKN